MLVRPAMKRLFFLKATNGLGRFAPSALPHYHTGREVNEARGPHTCSGPCAFEVKERNPTTRKTHHEILSSPATATTSRRRATKHVPRVTPYSHASIDPRFVEIGLACIRMYSQCCCAACIPFGALFSRQRSLFLYCDMYLRLRGCPVVLDIEPSVSAWCQKTRRVLLRGRRLLLLLLLAAESGGMRHKFQRDMQWSETK